MEIKRFHSKDINALRRLYLDSRTATFTWLDTSNFELLDFDRDTEGEQIWVASEFKEVIGFISIWKPESFIHHLFVSPESVAKGVGSKLLSVAKLHYPKLSLKCLAYNQRAIGFYLSKGFIIASTVDEGMESYHLMEFSAQT
ncbi:GNAT family N-acetyltransferase [Vibrio cortegadensis]|uniref:GNAT family N-acetyltransferase n=1 Tax=Vibrio cortegadensis TaxID=1328770 RepID=UPI00352E1220